MRAALAATILGLVLSAGLARAQSAGSTAPAPATTGQPPPADPELHQFLANTPVTLLDWGMLRLERDLEEATKALRLDRGREGPPRIGSQFRFFDRRVVGYLSVVVPRATRTEATCNELFITVRDQLLSGAPGGAQGAAWYLQRTFGSEFRGSQGRPEPFGDLLVDMVLLEVTLRPPESEVWEDGTGRIACAARLNAEAAVIIPPWRPRPQG